MQEQTQPEQEPQNVTIQAYSLADALTELQRYVQKGYEVDVETNGTYPMLIGSLMLFSVVKVGKKSTEVTTQDPTTESVEPPTTVDTEELKETLEDLVEAAVEAVEASQATAKRGRPKASA